MGRNGRLYKSVSAFSPICNTTQCYWGPKESNFGEWKKYDATELIGSFNPNGKGKVDILIDQGAADSFLSDGADQHNQLLPDNLVAASQNVNNVNVDLRYREGYDHSYYFIASFVQDHVEFHAH